MNARKQKTVPTCLSCAGREQYQSQSFGKICQKSGCLDQSYFSVLITLLKEWHNRDFKTKTNKQILQMPKGNMLLVSCFGHTNIYNPWSQNTSYTEKTIRKARRENFSLQCITDFHKWSSFFWTEEVNNSRWITENQDLTSRNTHISWNKAWLWLPGSSEKSDPVSGKRENVSRTVSSMWALSPEDGHLGEDRIIYVKVQHTSQ